MKAINFFELPVTNGVKTVELLHGDISLVDFPMKSPRADAHPARMMIRGFNMANKKSLYLRRDALKMNI